MIDTANREPAIHGFPPQISGSTSILVQLTFHYRIVTVIYIFNVRKLKFLSEAIYMPNFFINSSGFL